MTQTLIYTNPLNADFTNTFTVQAVGQVITGSLAPYGIARHVEIVNNSYYRASIYNTDPATQGGIRSEIDFTPFTLAQETWSTWMCRIPSAGWSDDGNLTIAQVHPLDSLVVAVNFLLTAKFNQFIMYVPANDPPTVGTTSNQIFLQSFNYDQWYNFCLHAYWINNDTGVLELFIDGVSRYKIYSRGTAYNADTPYLKLGLYDYKHNNDFGSHRYAEYQNINIWTGSGSYTTILGAPPLQPPYLVD